MEWRRVWLVIAVRDDEPARIEKVVETVAELRALLAAARTDRTVWHISYKSRRVLVGEQPTHCSCGRPYRTAGTLATPHEWLACSCDGHLWWLCRGCGKERVEPPVAYDCQPKTPHR